MVRETDDRGKMILERNNKSRGTDDCENWLLKRYDSGIAERERERLRDLKMETKKDLNEKMILERYDHCCWRDMIATAERGFS